ncbi:hypothetical protein [Bdellovibrio svalbardensis]|uniref:Uncharacterized protein n=1 Tax=Bdellovibrio svalbardensis TaxID=2972972 RepID=A0ABT6DI42_9BACT|nr:hypothetical protein [Bdellovibrio svalbardensis]MDG0816463.1 hypothetical protein [Bdellovibrio svalbardensis]
MKKLKQTVFLSFIVWLITFIDYLDDGCIDWPGAANVCGGQASLVFYLVSGVFIGIPFCLMLVKYLR